MMNYSRFSNPVLSLLIIFVACIISHAQSGRRAPRQTRAPEPPVQQAPTTAAPDAQTPATGSTSAATRDARPKTKLLVVTYNSTNRAGGSAITIFFNFNKRLNESDSYEAVSLGDMKRDEAERRAKAEKETYVIFVELESDIYQQGSVMNWPDLIVKYYVLAPQTGKVKERGRVYYQTMGGQRRPGNWPGDASIKITAEAAGIEAAERVLDWFRFRERQP